MEVPEATCQAMAPEVKQALDSVKNEKVYITVDIDGIDPAFAPGTGTPEPFGLHPLDVKKLINMIWG